MISFDTQVNSIINNLCQKFDVTMNQLVPELSRYYLASSLFYIILCLLIILFCAFSIKFIINKIEACDDNTEIEIIAFLYTLVVIFSIGIFISFVIMVGSINSFIMWNLSPRAKTIEYIINIARQQ